ncbi:protein maelstrom homolog [Dermacentor silvarum]|uniref:protein maelstrom homolog n=1 Tax=Dermacentor silvarum TaxID=543639 RepID=UPI00189A7CAD|nr:protein maelstrom homolog [Dermacentor silvarum]
MANDLKERGKGTLHNKFTSDGRSIASVLQLEDERNQQRRHMINSIHRYVDDIGTVDEIKRWPFYILSFNMLCKENGIYYPLQLGLVDYSIEQGFIRAFHKFIDPGPIPLGFASAAKDHSEATHGIPITGFEEGTTDYRSVVRDLMAYLRLPIDEANLPPLFCMQDHISQAACILAACCGSRNMGDGDKDRLALNMFCYQEEDTAEVVFRPKPASRTPQATALTRGHRWRRRLSHWATSSTATRSSEMALTISPIAPLLSKQMPYSLPAKVGLVDSHCYLDFIFSRVGHSGTYAKFRLNHRDTFPDCYEGCVANFCNPATFRQVQQLLMRWTGVHHVQI